MAEQSNDKPSESHTDHPLRHYDHTCPACKAEDLVKLLDYWRTFPPLSIEVAAVDIIEELQAELAEAPCALGASARLEANEVVAACTLSSAGTAITFEKWLSYQPYMVDNGLCDRHVQISKERMYSEDTVRAAWNKGPSTPQSARTAIIESWLTEI